LLPEILLVLAQSEPGAAPPLVRMQEGQAPAASARVEPPAEPLPDAGGDGVWRITTRGITLDFEGRELRGAPAGVAPDRYAGIGIWIEADGVTLRNARISGFRSAVYVSRARDVRLENVDVSDNWRQRLGSTAAREDEGDWLWPHENDANQWFERYGAGIWAEECTNLQVVRCRARDVQNGLVLDGVLESEVYDCDFSFLSGWGIALWRSSHNTITRNALDFCVRGYSHGVYSRGQDSAGILLFEQSSHNVIAENSATHGGDGLFGFAGREALGEAPPPGPGFDWTRRGSNHNLFYGNDFSYAAAHGLELTFSFDNVIARNKIEGCGECGIWAGYARDTRIVENTLTGNGLPSAATRAAVSAEHSQGLAILGNDFRGNSCGVRLWWDEDPALAALPWTTSNGGGCAGNAIAGNSFVDDALGIALLGCEETLVAENTFTRVAEHMAGESPAPDGTAVPAVPELAPPFVLGETRPVGARGALAGRDKILMTPFGPYDFEGPYLWRIASAERGEHRYQVLGNPERVDYPEATGCEVLREGDALRVRSTRPGGVARYRLEAQSGAQVVEASGVLVDWLWEAVAFAPLADPLADIDAWRAEADRGVHFQSNRLELAFASGGPSDLASATPMLREAQLAGDHFGIRATTRVLVPEGRWLLSTHSDDGIRVWRGDQLLIDDWSVHALRRHDAVIELAGEEELALTVEYFDQDGPAELGVRLEPLE
jgi:parallel beta-helix repeat protein